MTSRRAWPWLVLVLAVSRPAGAGEPAVSAAPSSDVAGQAKAHIDRGTHYFDVQQYAKAAEEYQVAYLLDPKPEYLYASAQAQRLAGDCTKALRSYAAYLRTKPPAQDQAKTQKNIERCEQELKDHPPVAEPSVVPLPSAGPPPPVPATVVPPPSPPVVARAGSPRSHDWAGHMLVGGGIAVAAAGLVFYLGGRATIRDYNSAATYDQFAARRGEVDAARTRQTLGVSAMAVGGGLVVGGVLHYIFHARSADHRVTAAVTPGGATVVVTRSF